MSVSRRRSDKALEAIVDRWISQAVKWAEVKGVKGVGLDEIALKKGHRDFVVIVTARVATGEVKGLGVLPARKKQTVKEFLAGMPKRGQRTIRTVCTDWYEGFLHAVQEVLGKAEVVVDRYPVAKLYREGADRLRQKELKRLKQELPKEEYTTRKGTLWAFRKNPAALEAQEQEVLARLFAYSPELARAYSYREQLTAIFEPELSQEEAKMKSRVPASQG